MAERSSFGRQIEIELAASTTLTEPLEVHLKTGDIVPRAEHEHLSIQEIKPHGSLYLKAGTKLSIDENGEIRLGEHSRVEITAELVFPDRHVRFNRFPAELRRGAIVVPTKNPGRKSLKAA